MTSFEYEIDGSRSVTTASVGRDHKCVVTGRGPFHLAAAARCQGQRNSDGYAERFDDTIHDYLLV